MCVSPIVFHDPPIPLPHLLTFPSGDGHSGYPSGDQELARLCLGFCADAFEVEHSDSLFYVNDVKVGRSRVMVVVRLAHLDTHTSGKKSRSGSSAVHISYACRSGVLCWICMLVMQMQPWTHLLDHADGVAPPQQHELDHRQIKTNMYLP